MPKTEYISPAIGSSIEYRTAVPAAVAAAFVAGFVTGFVTQSLKSLLG